MSRLNLQMCTENLGSETGSEDYSNDNRDWLNSCSEEEEVLENRRHQQQSVGGEGDGNQLMSVNYHYSVSRRSAVPRSFPPPLPSISCGDGSCIKMRSRRRNGRLVVYAVPVASQNYLHVRRHDGRLLLSFVDYAAISKLNNKKTVEVRQFPKHEQTAEQVSTPPSWKEIDQYQEQVDDEEEVEVLDRGAMVDVKVSTQPQPTGRVMKVLQSSFLVINKFVGGTMLTNQNRWVEPAETNHHSSYLWQTRSCSSCQSGGTERSCCTTCGGAACTAGRFWEAGCVATSS